MWQFVEAASLDFQYIVVCLEVTLRIVVFLTLIDDHANLHVNELGGENHFHHVFPFSFESVLELLVVGDRVFFISDLIMVEAPVIEDV